MIKAETLGQRPNTEVQLWSTSPHCQTENEATDPSHLHPTSQSLPPPHPPSASSEPQKKQ